MKNVTNKEISEYLGKSVSTINGWKVKQPELYELVRLGMQCKKGGVDKKALDEIIALRRAWRKNQ